MPRTGSEIIVVGAGIFGVTAALALFRRGHAVSLLDPGPLPHPLAASTDINKAVRMDYGADADYMAWMEEALEGWRCWNRELFVHTGPLFHEDGVTYLSRAKMAPGGFEYESYKLLRERGHHPERLDAGDIRRRFPAWNPEVFIDGYYNPEGGYAESGKVVNELLGLCTQSGVKLRCGISGKVERLLFAGQDVRGVVTADAQSLYAEKVVLAVGAWTPHFLPAAAPFLRSVGQPVFHLRPKDPTLYQAARFPCFGADIANTGYYGFPVNKEGVVKIANHGVGRPMHPESPQRQVTAEQTAALREFLRTAFPDLFTAPIVYTRVCLYADTWDEHLWIAPDPAHPGLVVATGDSGHGFKFAPVLGDLIADAVEGRADGKSARLLRKFRHRPEVSPQGQSPGESSGRPAGSLGEEAARYHG